MTNRLVVGQKKHREGTKQERLQTAQNITLYNRIPFIFKCFHDQKDSVVHEKEEASCSSNGQHKVGMIV